jgi:hypothetical protein
MNDQIKLKKTAEKEIIFRSYCMETCEVCDWCVEPYCENCGNLEDRQIDFGNESSGMTEAWYVPVCKLCGSVLPNQRKISSSEMKY